MEKTDLKAVNQRKNKGGRKPKKEAEKALYKVGGFRLTLAEKAVYDKMFKASGLENQTEFFRRVFFRGKLKLYYADSNTEKIYVRLLGIEKEINQIGHNYNQVVRRINALSANRLILDSMAELSELSNQINQRLEEIIRLFEQVSTPADKAPAFPEK